MSEGFSDKIEDPSKYISSSNRSPYRIQCNSSSNRSPYRIQCNSSSNRSPYRIQCNSNSNMSPYVVFSLHDSFG